MGWASGSMVANDIWEGVLPWLDPDGKSEVAIAIIRALEKHDWDTKDEAEELMAAAYKDDAFLLEEAEWWIRDPKTYTAFKKDMIEAMEDSFVGVDIDDDRMGRLWDLHLRTLAPTLR